MKELRLGAAVLVAIAMALLAAAPVQAAGSYLAQVRTTSYGIHHVKAGDWGSLGFGYGYIYASDNLCILARDIVAANGELARYFGDSGGNVNSDFFYTWKNNNADAQDFFDGLSAEGAELVRGYAAGYNRYLRETGVDGLPADCRGAEWVREIGPLDLLKVFYKLILRASSGALLELIVAAEPPAGPATGAPENPGEYMRRLDTERLKTMLRPELGSNMYALGGDATQSGHGMVLGNPHFDWEGPLRWYQIHLTIPGELDVMGASLQGVPIVNIGFNENVAWSHTVSFADRFTLYELTLVPGSPTSYLFDGEQHDMQVSNVAIQVLEGDELVTREHTFYESVFGPMLDFQPLGLQTWPSGIFAYAVADANAPNRRAVEQFLRMNLAADLDEFVSVLEQYVGLPWVHTVAAGKNGDAFYGDISAVPNVSDEMIDDCAPPVFGDFISELTGLLTLDGARSDCKWREDRDAPQPGIVGAARLPKIHTRGYVTNSNDNHWLTNPNQPLEGFPPSMGDERTIRHLRTRLGIKLVEDRLAGTDGLGDALFTLPTLQAVLYGARNYAAEMLIDELGAVCAAEGPLVDLGGEVVDVGQACAVLIDWDRKQGVASVGPQIFLEFLEAANDELGDDYLSGLFEIPFDVDDPVNTPRGLADETGEQRAALMRWLAQGVARLNGAGIAMDAPWGEVQFSERNGVRIPIHGGRDGTGMFSIITSDLVDGVGYGAIRHGNSYVQTVTWDENGVVADAILTYSQSSDPESAHYADQTELYSNGGWVRLPFTEAQIRADPNLITRRLRERRRDPGQDPRLRQGQ